MDAQAPDTLNTIIQVSVAAVGALSLFYAGFRAGIKKIGQAIPGDDAVERFDHVLEEKVDPVVKAVEDAIDGNPNG